MRADPGATDFLAGGGEMGERIRAHDWAATPLGPVEAWPQSLRTATGIMLNSRFPTYMAWGDALTSLYNDAYRPILGSKPDALGRPFAEVWSEIWPTVGPIAARAMRGEASWFENLPLSLERHGYAEETWWTFSYSPVRDESGGVGGLICTVHETTAEVRARAALQTEKDRLQALFQQAPGLMSMYRGPDHVFEFANAAYLDFIGRRDVLGKSVREAFPDLEGQGIVELLDRVHATGEPFVGRQMPVELRRGPDAAPETHYVDFVFQPVFDGAGRVTGIFAEGHDVTEAKRAEAALRESEARFRLFSEVSREGVVIHDGDVVLDCNLAYARMFGFAAPEELIGRPITDVIASGSIPLAQSKMRERAEEPFEVVARRRDGSTLPAEIVARETTWKGRRVRIVLARDLTEQRRAEAQIRASHARHQAAIRASGHLFYDWDSATNGLAFGENVERILGYSAEEMSGGLERWLEVVHPDDRQAFVDEIDRVLATGEPFRLDFRVVRKDGRVIDVEDEGYFLHGVDGQIEHMVGFVRDVTTRRQAEREREAERARLEAVLRQLPVGVIIAEAPSGRLLLGNEQVDRIWRHGLLPLAGVQEYRAYRGFDRRTGRELAPQDWPLARSITAGESVLAEEIDFQRGDGSRGTLEVSSAPILDEAGRIVAGVVVFSDITERTRAERHQRLLVNELNHRVKNTLTTVQSLAGQTFRGEREDESARRTFEGRLFALAKAHDMLTRENWEGAELSALVAEVLSPYRTEPAGGASVASGGGRFAPEGGPADSGRERFAIEGPPLRVSPRMALALAMALHELATNAAKYGSLSVPEGRVGIRWSVVPGPPDRLDLTWREVGGPPVAPPRRRGFGTRLIERSLAQELAGEARLVYEPAGLLCRVTAPLDTTSPITDIAGERH
ncbi:MAG TPA: PAS domain S-box protein [Microvirga sp.]|nr:PAS domain S-box protein [Microvirga sp.]